MLFKGIIEKLNVINGISRSHSESWTYLTFEGSYNNCCSNSYFSELYDIFENEGVSNAIVFFIDNERIECSEFIEELYNGCKWNIHINKTCWLDKFDDTNICHTFFYYKDSFAEWAKNSNPFEEDYPLNKGCYHVYVKEIIEDFGGPNLIVNESDSVNELTLENYLPDFHVENYIRINCNSDFIIAPHKQIMCWGNVNNISRFFYRNAVLVLLAALCDEITKDGKVVIRGYKTIVTDLGWEMAIEDNLLNYHSLLLEVYKWVYQQEDSYAIKKRLFAERSSLDIDKNITLYASLYPILSDVYSQIKEQYSYIMYDRKDSYQKELKDLLKDIKNVMDLFSCKIRNILSNLLRDVLAALILIGITLFSKISEVSALFDNSLINYVFKAFGVYFWLSAILQIIFDVIDTNRSFKELNYWQNVTRSYISTEKFRNYKEQTINKRFTQLSGYYITIILLYISIGTFCFYYQDIWKTALSMTSTESVENSNNIHQQTPNSTNISTKKKKKMIQLYDASIETCMVHFVGNKSKDEGIKLSKEPLLLDNPTTMALSNYFYKSFTNKEDYFSFYHQTNIELNTIYSYIKQIFTNKDCFCEQSLNIAKYLYEQCTHPQIKGGELYIAYIDNCIIDGKYIEVIGLFKSENKDTFLKINTQGNTFEIESERGTNINKLDKGCLIFNLEKENGYVVAIVDNTNKGAEAKYWTDDFLHVRPRKDSFNQTQNMISLCKSFVSQLPAENGKIEKATYMNRSVEALKEESVNIDSFAEQVFETPELVSEFKQYKETYQKERDIEIDDTFETASTAIKRRATGTMTTIKLDKNFDINIHGGEQYIERGYDEKRGMYYYQLFFREEK